jgi:hypothetical protein
VPENGSEGETERGVLQGAPTPRPARSQRALTALGILVLVVAVAVAWRIWRPFAPEPTALTSEARRHLVKADLWAEAAAAAVVLADVRADVTGTLRPDEVRALAPGMMARVRRAVDPVRRSEAVSNDELEDRLARLDEALRLADPDASEAVDALLRLVAKVEP